VPIHKTSPSSPRQSGEHQRAPPNDVVSLGPADHHRTILVLAIEEYVAREVGGAEKRAERGRELCPRRVEPHHPRVPERDAATHLLELASPRVHDVACPIDVASVRHGDHESVGGAERDNRRAILSSALPAHMVYDRERREQPRDGSQERVREDAIHASHESREVHDSSVAPKAAVANVRRRTRSRRWSWRVTGWTIATSALQELVLQERARARERDTSF
jgi:hypothetical protein